LFELIKGIINDLDEPQGLEVVISILRYFLSCT